MVILLLYAFNDKNIFYFQERPGLYGKIFVIYKFKTMADAYDARGNLLPDDVRTTRLGRFIRSTSIDEILQLVNVLKGDMSIIGPRPLLVKYLPLYSDQQRKRHNVKPGITVWAQVNGRNSIRWEEKFNLDVYYVENISFLLDLKIVLKTIASVFRRSGINSEGKDSVIEFNGLN